MNLVIDSSITLASFFEDERSNAADAVLSDVADHGAIAPSLWRLEVANILQDLTLERARGSKIVLITTGSLLLGNRGMILRPRSP